MQSGDSSGESERGLQTLNSRNWMLLKWFPRGFPSGRRRWTVGERGCSTQWKWSLKCWQWAWISRRRMSSTTISSLSSFSFIKWKMINFFKISNTLLTCWLRPVRTWRSMEISETFWWIAFSLKFFKVIFWIFLLLQAGLHTDLNLLTIHSKSQFPALYIWLKDGKN